MDKPKVTPKDFVFWVGAMVSLYAGVVAFIALLFEYINKASPNPVSGTYYIDPYSSGISYETAALIVLTPVFLVLMRFIRRGIVADPSRNEIWIRRWALFLTLFLAGATIVVDLIVLLNTYLQGEDLTAGFLLKVLTVLLVAGLGFVHFIADLWGYWEREPMRARLVNWGVGLLVIVTILAGFFIVGTPQQIRAQKQDAIRVQDLQAIQWQIVNYWQQKEKLPAALSGLNDPITNNILPLDPQTKEAYEYSSTGALSFKLCATFANEGGTNVLQGRSMPLPTEPVGAEGKDIQDNWQHAAGRVCFERTIDPQRYPPYSKQKGF
ncbi:hypothetical protein A3D71_01565 [Candidatus Kaiserbacteria bacterium RIFCSPHIGHO2_02_FULL_55_20]|uniref:DUF5671 domain-containing protein n=1 Tax=Candidatus Kaiserbacteria bacterium RIFCSPHIGHO2_02_FULL_55_20 TaxID=1798497 RepID=A0A1F6DXW2_9BACT|nr:MAG: hypothetical protein A2680_01095 [Candidatus Kaiserbacteria bacterium RIFCSPHIGHO2_01_FULL_55_37]OGG66187.1 MAG: hypothetical protein A3D71_01565 [Candidatus Kaiserbacteria bacterium RIFCSPHIGHO2_02_FULL_55_20]